jgi:hypothetical protein
MLNRGVFNEIYGCVSTGAPVKRGPAVLDNVQAVQIVVGFLPHATRVKGQGACSAASGTCCPVLLGPIAFSCCRRAKQRDSHRLCTPRMYRQFRALGLAIFKDSCVILRPLCGQGGNCVNHECTSHGTTLPFLF